MQLSKKVSFKFSSSLAQSQEVPLPAVDEAGEWWPHGRVMASARAGLQPVEPGTSRVAELVDRKQRSVFAQVEDHFYTKALRRAALHILLRTFGLVPCLVTFLLLLLWSWCCLAKKQVPNPQWSERVSSSELSHTHGPFQINYSGNTYGVQCTALININNSVKIKERTTD